MCITPFVAFRKFKNVAKILIRLKRTLWFQCWALGKRDCLIIFTFGSKIVIPLLELILTKNSESNRLNKVSSKMEFRILAGPAQTNMKFKGIRNLEIFQEFQPRTKVSNPRVSQPKPLTPRYRQMSERSSDTYRGWLFKWTNYIKGYQRRWFVLANGYLSYYRSQQEMSHTCRGTQMLITHKKVKIKNNYSING